MINQFDKQFIERCLDNFLGRASLLDVTKEPPFDPEDGGVPPTMFDGEINNDGWVKWKMLPSTLTETDVVEIEKILPGQFPPLFRAFLTTRFLMSIETSKVRLPALPSDNPLNELLAELNGWSPLFPSGFIAFAEDGNDAGPLCFDFHERLPDNDCPIVFFDHDNLITLGEELCGDRTQVIPYAMPAYPSFRQLLEDVFLS